MIRVEVLRTYFVIKPSPTDAGCCEYTLLYFDEYAPSSPSLVYSLTVCASV